MPTLPKWSILISGLNIANRSLDESRLFSTICHHVLDDLR